MMWLVMLHLCRPELTDLLLAYATVYKYLMIKSSQIVQMALDLMTACVSVWKQHPPLVQYL